MGKTNKEKIQEVELTMQEIWQHTQPKIHKSRKDYKRRPKHKNKGYD